ncbi:MAG: P-II family nitrogen regulator, partial [bacterium]|nr:P-II family nitrogen regulator [bacterium]
HILEEIGRVGRFDDQSGAGIAVQIDIEDAVGVQHQIRELSETVEENL